MDASSFLRTASTRSKMPDLARVRASSSTEVAAALYDLGEPDLAADLDLDDHPVDLLRRAWLDLHAREGSGGFEGEF